MTYSKEITVHSGRDNRIVSNYTSDIYLIFTVPISYIYLHIAYPLLVLVYVKQSHRFEATLIKLAKRTGLLDIYTMYYIFRKNLTPKRSSSNQGFIKNTIINRKIASL